MGSCFGKTQKTTPKVPISGVRAASVRRPLATGFDYDYCFKIIVLGDSGVGKSSLIMRFADNTFTESYLPTIGVDFKIRTVTVDDKQVKLSIWDTAGQERFRTITCAYYRGANAIILVFDITNLESYRNVERWMTDVQRYASADIPVLLIGNKTDAASERQVAYDVAKEFAEVRGFKYFEASAKDSTNVESSFLNIAETLVKKIEEEY